jgi:FkbM family methyltransferase
MRHFRNFPELIQAVRKNTICSQTALWNGLRISHPSDQNGFASVLVETWVEEAYTARGFYLPRDGDVVFDIGANVGVFSLYLASASRCRVIALEPFPENFEYLQRNVRDNHLDNVEMHRMALNGATSRAYMQRVGNRSLDHVLTHDASNVSAFETTTCTLAELLDLTHVETAALLKMDIEGSEKAVFEQATPKTLSRFARIALEYHDNLQPGTLDVLRRRLTATHEFEISRSTVKGCGIIRAILRN